MRAAAAIFEPDLMSDLFISMICGASVVVLFAGLRRIALSRDVAIVFSRLGGMQSRHRKAREPILKTFGERIAKTQYGARMRSRILPRHPAVSFSDALAAGAASVLGGVVTGAIAFGGGAMVVLCGLAGPVVLDRLALRWGGRRVARLEQQLPDALLVQAAALRAGHSISRSLRAVSEEIAPPLREEISTLVRELDLGVSIEAALENFKQRAGGRDSELWVTSMLVHKATGGNLAESVEDLGDRIRSRLHLRGEVRALTAQGRMSGAVVAAAPLGFFAVLSVTSKDQMNVLFTTPLGLTILVIGAAMELAGFIWIRRILRVKA